MTNRLQTSCAIACVLSSCVLVVASIAGSDIYAAGMTQGCGAEYAPAASNPSHSIARSEFCKPQTWGSAEYVVQVRRLYISDQPDEVALLAAKNEQVSVIVNLRDHDESNWDEQAATERLGLAYYNVPVQKSAAGFSADAILQISQIVQGHPDAKILIHCSSGNRAAAWLAIHLKNDHDMPMDDAISLAQLGGLTNDAMKMRVRKYLTNEKSSESR